MSEIARTEEPLPDGRRERRSRETRERIFRCALEIFAEKGFAATTIGQITEAADVGKGTFFNYFENKESILMEYREMQMGRVKEFVASHLSSDLPLTRLLTLLALTMTAEFQASPAMFHCLLTAILSNQAVQRRMSEGLENAREMLGRLLADRQARGEIPGRPAAREMAASFQGMVLGTTLVWSLSPLRPLEETLTCAVELFVGGMASSPAACGGKP
ncbi:TetR family transcriptional regulator [Geomonas sp. Red276]